MSVAEPLTGEVGEALRAGDRDRLLRAFSAFGEKMRSEGDVRKRMTKEAADAMASLADALEAEAAEMEEADPGDPENQEKAKRLRQLAKGLGDLSQAMKNGDSAKAREKTAFIKGNGTYRELVDYLSKFATRTKIFIWSEAK